MRRDWAGELSACRDIAAVRALFIAEIARFDYTAAACGSFLPTARGPQPYFFFQHWPQSWIELYQTNKWHLVDFSVAEARRRIAPFTWQEVKAGRTLSKAESALWEAALQRGWRDGLSVPFHGPGGYLGLVTMAGERQLAPLERDTLHMLAFHTHERCRSLSSLAWPNEAILAMTSRELECLRWVVAGKTDAETAVIVGLSRETVKGYVDSARAKLGATTRPQAAARLVFAGLS